MNIRSRNLARAAVRPLVLAFGILAVAVQAQNDAPVIVNSPQSRGVFPGASAKLAVSAVGAPLLNYQWYVGESGETRNPIPNATGAEYTTTPLTSLTAYWVQVTNAKGSADSQTAWLRILPPVAVVPLGALPVSTSGLADAVVVADHYAYVAAEAVGLQVVDVSDLANPRRVGSYDPGGTAVGVAVAGSVAYMAEEEAGLEIIDVSNPADPRRLGGYNPHVRDYPGGRSFGVAVAGRYAYLTDGEAGVHVIDVFDPAQPRRVGGWPTKGFAYGVVVEGTYAYVTDGKEGFMVVDVADPTKPKPGRVLDLEGFAMGMAVANQHAYVALLGVGLQAIDISLPIRPELRDVFRDALGAGSVAVAGNRAYVAAGEGGLWIVDVSDPTELKLLDQAPTNTVGNAKGVAVVGRYAYVAGRAAGLRIVDVAKPNDPIGLGGVDLNPQALAVAVAGQRAYVVEGDAGLEVVDVSNPSALRRLGGFDTSGYAVDVALSGHQATVADGYGGLQVIDVSDPANPWRAGGYDTAGKATGVAAQGQSAYLADGGEGLQAIDFTVAASPVRRGGVDTDGDAGDVALLSSYACVADGPEGLQVIDLAPPEGPQRVGRVDTSGHAVGVAVAGHYAYVADGEAGLQVIDLADPEHPRHAGGYDTSGNALGVAVEGPYAYVADGEAGLQVIDVSDPADPQRVGDYDTRGNASGVAVANGVVYVADGGPGLATFRVTPLGASPPFITQQPQDRIVGAGQAAFLEVKATGAEPLRYRWYSGPRGDTSRPIPGATEPGYTTPLLSATTAYWVRVTNRVGLADSDLATVTVAPPPIIAEQPAGGTVAVGGHFAFAVTATGWEPLHYQWHHNGVAIEGATASELVLTAVQPERAGIYIVTITDPFGNSALSAGAALKVDVCAPAAAGLVGWWKGQGTANDSAGANHGTLLNGAAYAPGVVGAAFALDGQDDVVAIPDSPAFGFGQAMTIVAWVNPLRPEGIVVSQYDASVGQQSWAFRMLPDGFLGFQVVAPSGAVFGVSTVNLAVPSGEFTLVAAAVDLSRPSIELFVNGVAAPRQQDPGSVPLAAFFDSRAPVMIGGAVCENGAICQPFAGRVDEVLLFNRRLAPGEIAAISAAGVAGLCPDTAPPAVVGQPRNLVVAVGQAATFTVIAGGPGPFLYQWRLNGYEVAGGNQATLALGSARVEDAGWYTVAIRNAAGEAVSQPALLTVLTPPVIVRTNGTPEGPLVSGTAVTLEAQGGGATAPSYQWFKDGGALPRQTASRFIVEHAELEDSGAYTVQVSEGGVAVVSAPHELRVYEPAMVFSHPPPRMIVQVGQPQVTLTVGTSGSNLRYQWRKNGADLLDDESVTGAQTPTLTFREIRLEDAGMYTVIVWNEVGQAIGGPVELVVTGPTEQPPGDNFADAVYLDERSNPLTTTNTFATRETNEPWHFDKEGHHSIWFRWEAPGDGQMWVSTVGSAFDTLLGVYTGERLGQLVKVGGDEDSGGYFTGWAQFNVKAKQEYRIAVDGLGRASGRVVLEWKFVSAPPLPEIAQDPQSQTALRGSTISLKVEAKPPGSVGAYQWYFNRAPLAGETGDTLVLPSLQDDQVGLYAVDVIGPGGTVRSQAAQVEIGEDPRVRSYDKFEYLFPPPPKLVSLHQPATGVPPLHVAVGTPTEQVLNNSEATTQKGETNACGPLGGKSLLIPVETEIAGVLEVRSQAGFATVLVLWTYDPDTRTNLACGTGGSLQYAGAQAGGQYVLAVYGVASASGVLPLTFRLGSVLPEPLPGDPPQREVVPGGSAELHCPVPHQPGFRYQWYKDGKPLEGQTNASLQILIQSAEDSGIYSVAVNSGLEQKEYPVVELIVLVQPEPSPPKPPKDGRFTLLLQGTPGQMVEVQSSEDLLVWTPENRVWLPDEFAEPALRSQRYYRTMEVPLTNEVTGMQAGGRKGWRVTGGRLRQGYRLDKSADGGRTWEAADRKRVQKEAYHYDDEPTVEYRVTED